MTSQRYVTAKPKIVTVAGQKGGITKSTIVVALAVEWHRRGLRVLVIDADDAKQRSVSVWSECATERGNDVPPVVRVGDDLAASLHRLARGYDVVIIDTPGHLTGRTAHALGQSDLALLPCGKGAFEVWAMGMTTAPALHDIRAVSRKLDVCIVVTRVRGDTAASRRITETLAGTGFPVLETFLARREAYDDSIAAGEGPSTYKPTGKHAEETRALVDEIGRRLRLPKAGRRAARTDRKASDTGNARGSSAAPAAPRGRRAATRGAGNAAIQGTVARGRDARR